MIHHIRAALIGLVVAIAQPAAADPANETFHFLPSNAYFNITGCEVGSSYDHAMRSALYFLIFPESDTGNPNNKSIEYTRRHVRPLLADLKHAYPDANGALDKRCLPPSLEKAAKALRLLAPDGQYTGEDVKIDYQYSPNLLDGKPSPEALPVQSRAAYMTTTGCKVSPAAYEHYRTAVEWLLFQQISSKNARGAMLNFLTALTESRPTVEPDVDPQCMTPGIALLGYALGITDAEGKHRTE